MLRYWPNIQDYYMFRSKAAELTSRLAPIALHVSFSLSLEEAERRWCCKLRACPRPWEMVRKIQSRETLSSCRPVGTHSDLLKHIFRRWINHYVVNCCVHLSAVSRLIQRPCLPAGTTVRSVKTWFPESVNTGDRLFGEAAWLKVFYGFLQIFTYASALSTHLSPDSS